MLFSQKNRPEFIEKLQSEEFDLLIIGGGVTGCGIALDAALRGMKVALIEKADFASGTSSRSTKLVHGGLRYLKQMELKLVHDVGRERATVYKNARHIVIPEKMLLPIVKNGSLSKHLTSFALWLYDFLAGVKDEEKRKMLDKKGTLQHEPLLNDEILLGGGLYYEYRTDDARLVIELAKTAFANGAFLLNYVEAVDLVYDNQKQLIGVEVMDTFSDKKFEIKALRTVNAAGPFVDLIRKKDNSLFAKRLQLTKGVHIVFPQQKFNLKQAVYFDVKDGRMIFAIPRNGITYVGTTDTLYVADMNRPTVTQADVQYLLNAVNEMFPSLRLTQQDIISSWAGLRPLIYEDGKSPSELSRKDEVMVSASGLISIAGGKLTGYRLMAEKITDLVASQLSIYKKYYSKSSTKKCRLSGGEFESKEEMNTFLSNLKLSNPKLATEKIETLFYRYGRNIEKIIAFYSQTNDWLVAEIKYCIEHEMTAYADDFAVRRTGMVFFQEKELEEREAYIIEQFSKLLLYNDYQLVNSQKQLQLVISDTSNFD